MKIIVLREIFSTVGPSSSSREPANQRKTTENGPRILCQSSARVTINQTFTQEGVPTPKREPGSTDVVTVASKMRKKNKAKAAAGGPTITIIVVVTHIQNTSHSGLRLAKCQKIKFASIE